jgi:EpsD family peptidyl-prolyl cis-trans isomerase
VIEERGPASTEMASGQTEIQQNAQMNSHAAVALAIVLGSVAVATGCDQKGDAKPATQVAARVNADEITVHQVNNVLARNQNIRPEAAPQAKRQILDGLINQQLARQKAIESKLDRTPNVVQAIEAAKTEILARAYLEQVAAAIPKTADWEVQKYYKEHPELFAQRRLFTLEELAFVAAADVAAELRGLLSKTRSMQEIADWLQSREVKFAVNRGVRAAEQIPLEMLPRLQAMKEGQLQLFESAGDRYQVIRVMAYKTEPIDEASAAPRIQQFLWNRRTSDVIAKEMTKIKEQAKIEYMGEFAEGAAATATKAGADAAAQERSPEPAAGQPPK